MVEEMVEEVGGGSSEKWREVAGQGKLGCCFFWWPLLAANEEGEEKMKEREDGRGYLYKGKVQGYYKLPFPQLLSLIHI